MNKKYIIVMGPTGVGKSDLAVLAANRMHGEIINGDVGQFYTPLSIGTAKPNWKQEQVPHHLFDVLSSPVDCTVVDYRRMVSDSLQSLWGNNKVPFIVGGSGFYIQSLFFPPLEQPSQTLNNPIFLEKTWDQLYVYDPERALSIDKNDTYRIERACDFILKTGQKASDYVPVYNPLDGNALIVFLTRDRSELYDRINKRVLLMMEQGWKKEVEDLMQTPWQEFLLKKKLIGYNDLIHNINRDLDFESMVFQIQKKTRHYAKRQETFWRAFEKKVQPFMINNQLILKKVNLSLNNAEEKFIDIIQNFLSKKN